MPNDAIPQTLNWKEPYQLAMLEMDARKLPLLIDRANEAILDRIENGDARSLKSEIHLLNDALNNLRLLRREYEQAFQEYRKLRNRKSG